VMNFLRALWHVMESLVAEKKSLLNLVLFERCPSDQALWQEDKCRTAQQQWSTWRPFGNQYEEQARAVRSKACSASGNCCWIILEPSNHHASRSHKFRQVIELKGIIRALLLKKRYSDLMKNSAPETRTSPEESDITLFAALFTTESVGAPLQDVDAYCSSSS
jgi:hypothetical protein